MLFSNHAVWLKLTKAMKSLPLLLLMLICLSTSARDIDTSYAIRIGGINQWVRLTGEDISKPILLWLHGGPGGSVMDKAGKFSKKLEAYFLVAHWDQRETGKTLNLNKSTQPLSLSLFQNDTHDLIDSLLAQFHQRKIYLAGFSWGTALGFYIADKYPELLYAYVAISPMINQLESERMALAMLKRNADSRQKMEELSLVSIPFVNGEQLYYHRKWLFAFDGQKSLKRTFPKKIVLKWSSTWLSVFNEASKVNLIATVPEVKCPIYFFAGRNDHQTASAITGTYYQGLRAPKKELFWFEHSGHLVTETEPELMQDIIINKILLQTYSP
jgi:pimeloyl-ACP methyl ester carboxylesterase